MFKSIKNLWRRLFRRQDQLPMYVGVEPYPLCVVDKRHRQEQYFWRVAKQG